MVAIPFSEGCVFVQGSQGSSRIESKSSYERALKTLEKTFEARIRRPPATISRIPVPWLRSFHY
jgi:hypothetical protein